MIKANIIHDSIVLVDTMIKRLEQVSKLQVEISPVVDFFNSTINVFTAFATISALFSIVISLYAIYKTTNDSRKQILAHKIEEVYELVVALSITYGYLHEVYNYLEKSIGEDLEVKARQNLVKHFYKLNLELKEKFDIEDLLKKTMRLNVLANTYLKGSIKFDVIAYSQLFVAILYIIKYEDIKMREPEFKEPLPTANNLFNLSEDISEKLVKVIGYGTDNKGYIAYRNTTFKEKIHPKTN